MFCEKCGNKLHEGDAFCERCGAPVAKLQQPESQPVNEQPVNEQPVSEPVSEPVKQPVNEPVQYPDPNGGVQPVEYNPAAQGFATNQQTQPIQPNQPVQPKVKKPFPKKLVIICSAAAVAVIGIIVALCILIPNMNKLKVEDYISVYIDEEYLYNGYAKATVSISQSEIEADRLTDGDTDTDSSDYSWSDLYNDAKIYNASVAIGEILEYAEVNAYVKDADGNTVESTVESYSTLYTDLENLHKDDTIVVEVTWDNSDSAKKDISKLEKTAGFKFDRTDFTTEISVADALSEQNAELADVEEIDVISYIRDNDLVKTTGVVDGDYSVTIESFEYTVGNYTVRYDQATYYTSVGIYDEYETELDSFYFDITKSSDLSVGSKFKISTSQTLFEDEGLLLVENSADYTVAENTVLTSATAKDNLDKITAAADEYITENIERFTDYSATDIYYVTPKASAYDSAQAYILVVEKGKYKSYFSTYNEYYYGICIENPYLIGDELYSTEIGTSSSAEKLDSFKKYNTFLSSDDYTCTKIN